MADATNILQVSRASLKRSLTTGDVSAGAVVAVNDMIVFALEDDSTNVAECLIPGCTLIATLTVTAKTNGGSNSAVAVGEKLYIDGSEYNKDTGGTFFGYALGAVDAGESAAIAVAVFAGA